MEDLIVKGFIWVVTLSFAGYLAYATYTLRAARQAKRYHKDTGNVMQAYNVQYLVDTWVDHRNTAATGFCIAVVLLLIAYVFLG